MRALVLAILLTCTVASAAGAGGSGGGGLDGPQVSVGLKVFAPGGDGSQSYGPGDTNAPSPVRYEAVPAHSPPPGLDNLCNAARGPVTDGTVAWGWWYTITTIDNATGAVISTEVVCVALPVGGGTGPPPPPALPAPPTIAQIWDAVGLPAPRIGISPDAEGVVGLDTWLWSGGPTDVAVAVTIGGYTVTGTAHLSEYRFDAGDGVTTTAPSAGSAAVPALTHVFDVKGTYTVGAASVWDATVTMTGVGLPTPVPVAIGTAVLTSTRDYPVVEVRSVLVP